MRIALIFLLLSAGSAAQAHPGHIADLAGHDHWVAGAAIGIAILTGLLGALKGQKKSDDAPESEIEEEGAVA